jgi:hypothetical protein
VRPAEAIAQGSYSRLALGAAFRLLHRDVVQSLAGCARHRDELIGSCSCIRRNAVWRRI